MRTQTTRTHPHDATNGEAVPAGASRREPVASGARAPGTTDAYELTRGHAEGIPRHWVVRSRLVLAALLGANVLLPGYLVQLHPDVPKHMDTKDMLQRMDEEGLVPTDARDAWGRPLEIRSAPQGNLVTSAGADGRFGTPDDITHIIGSKAE